MRPVAAGIHTRVLERAPQDWGALLAADPASSGAHRPGVWAAFTAASAALESRVVVVEEQGRSIGGAALVIEQRAGFRWLHALPMLLPAAPIALPGRHAEVDLAVASAFDALAREEGIVGGEWSLNRAGGPAVRDAALAALGGETRWFESAVVDLKDGPEGALKRMERKHRQSLAHARRQRLAFAEEPAALEAAYALHVTQSRAWGGHRPLPLELSRRLLADTPAGPHARLFTLRDAQGVLSSALAIDGPHDLFVWWSGTHPAGRRRQAFTLLLWQIIEWAAAHGRTRVDLGASTGLSLVATFKQALGARGERFPVRWLDDRYAPSHARLLARLQRYARAGRPQGERA
jgi:hypothetical protein